MAAAKKLTRSQEDYLEAILHLVRRQQVARVRDIAKRLGVGMSSVTAALKGLARRGLVNYDPYQLITMTDRGREAAEEISNRHDLLQGFLTDVLGMDAPEAADSACRLEHAVGPVVLERLEKFAEFIRGCPRAGADWIESFSTRCADGPARQRCRGCVGRVARQFAAPRSTRKRG